MSSSRSTAEKIEYYDVALPTFEMVEQREAKAPKRMRPGIKPKKADNELTKEELAVRDRRRKRNKEAAAKKRIEFKQTVGMLESKKAKLESENESIITEVSQMKTRIAKMKAALREHPCVENNNHQVFFPQKASQEFYSDFTAGVEQHFSEAVPAPASYDEEKIAVSNDFFDDIFGSEEPTKMLLMNSLPSYEETQRGQTYVQPNQTQQNRSNCPLSFSAMDLENLFSVC